jgi:uncharacterized protein YgbK (DUF1537 family)
MTVTVVADDLTGACDTGACFAGRGPVPVEIWETGLEPTGAAAVALDTESRELAAADAAARCRAMVAGRRLGAILFKKIDSTMRGAVGAELDALLDASGLGTALVCPAFPEQDRRVEAGELLVGPRPAHLTAVGRDPSYPAPTSRVPALLEGQSRRPVRHLSLAEVRSPEPELLALLRGAAGCLVSADATRASDLEALARAGARLPGLLLAGSAGLGRAVAARLGLAPAAPARLPPPGAWLVVVGSRHEASRIQLAALREAAVASGVAGEPETPDRLAAALRAGQPAVLASPDEPGERGATAAALAGGAAEAVERGEPSVLLLVGGDTARAVLARLRPRRLALLGAPGPGLALAELQAGGGGRLPVITKAGGFGRPGLLVELLRLGAPAPRA